MILLFIFLTLGVCTQWNVFKDPGPSRFDYSKQARPSPESSACFCVQDGFYIINNVNEMWKFEYDTQRWIWLPNVYFPMNASIPHWNIEHNLFVFVQDRYLGQFNLTQRSWTYTPALPVYRTGSTIWTDHTKRILYMYGGKDGNGTLLDEFWSYYIDSKTWNKLPSFGARAFLPGAGGYIYDYDRLWVWDGFVWSDLAAPRYDINPGHMWHQGGDTLLLYMSGITWKIINDEWTPLHQRIHLRSTSSCSDVPILYEYEGGTIEKYGSRHITLLGGLEPVLVISGFTFVLVTFCLLLLIAFWIVICIERRKRSKQGPFVASMQESDLL